MKIVERHHNGDVADEPVATSGDVNQSGALELAAHRLSIRRYLSRALHRHMDATEVTANSTLASQVMWRLAMRMSLHNENRLLQHFSRSILSMGAHKDSDRIHTTADEGEPEIKIWHSQPPPKLLTNTPSSDTSDETSQSAPESDRPSRSSRESTDSAQSLPSFPSLAFSPSNTHRSRLRGTSFQTYLNWSIKGIRPGLSVRIVRTEMVASMPSVTQYVVQVVDLHTQVFWISKKRFSDIYMLRKQIRDAIKNAPAFEAEELRFLLDLPFPRRRLRKTSLDSDIRRVHELEVFLRNVASLDPSSKVRVEILGDFQDCLCSSDFIESLEKVDTRGEAPEPKWLSYDLFMRLNSIETVEGHTCYKFLHAFRNRCAVVEAAACHECYNSGDTTLAADALRELRTVLTSVEKYIIDHLSPNYADQFSLLDQSVDVTSVVDDSIFRAVEDAILVPLEKEIAFLVRQTVDVEQEAKLMANIAKMRGRPQSEFGISEHLQSDEDWGKSCHHLSMVDERQLPCEKIQELLLSALEIFKSCGEKNLEWRENSALTADDYLPIHIYVVIHSGLKRPLLTKEYLGAMIHPSKMLSEVGYFLTMFEVALQYIADIASHVRNIARNAGTVAARGRFFPAQPLPLDGGAATVPADGVARRAAVGAGSRQGAVPCLRAPGRTAGELCSVWVPPDLLSGGTRLERTSVSLVQAIADPSIALQECDHVLMIDRHDERQLFEQIHEDLRFTTDDQAKALMTSVLTRKCREERRGRFDQSIHSWEEFIQQFTDDSRWLNDARAVRLTSSVYTFVSTISNFLPVLNVSNASSHDKIRLHIVGARAEAMMPLQIWQELTDTHRQLSFDIKLVGDHVVPSTYKTKFPVDLEDRLRITNYLGFYHDIAARNDDLRVLPDAFVLFNPGIGHPRLCRSWRPTMEMILASGKPMLLTSFSKCDQDRDVNALHDIATHSMDSMDVEFVVAPQENEFRSRCFQLDPLDVFAPIQTNRYAMVVRGSRI